MLIQHNQNIIKSTISFISFFNFVSERDATAIALHNFNEPEVLLAISK